MKDEKVFLLQKSLCWHITIVCTQRKFQKKVCHQQRSPGTVEWTAKVVGDLPTNHHLRLLMGLQLAEWRCFGRARLCCRPLCERDWSRTESAAFLCESFLSSDLFPFTFASSLLSKVLPSGILKKILLSEEGKPTQTLISPGLPMCQANI